MVGYDLRTRSIIRIGIKFRWSENVIKAYDGPLNGYTTHMVDLGTYIFKVLNTGKITPEEFFTNAYVG